MIYLDSAATSFYKPTSVRSAVNKALTTMASPGRGAYPPAMLASETLTACREAAAALFTFNATHALNLAIRTLYRPGMRVVISGFEHNSVTRPLHALGAEMSIAGKKLFDPDDTIENFRRLLPGAGFAVCTCVSNVFGYILPVREIAALCREENVPLILDASQSAGVLDLDMQSLAPAFAAMPGHKALMGPQGTGLLLCGQDAAPLLFGGSGSDSMEQLMPVCLPDRLEAGTHNVCGIAGLLAGIRAVRQMGLANIAKKEEQLLRSAVPILERSDLGLFVGMHGTQSGVLSQIGRAHV